MRTWIVAFAIGLLMVLPGCRKDPNQPEIIPGTDLGPAPSVSRSEQAQKFPHEMTDKPTWYECLSRTDLSKDQLNECRNYFRGAESDRGKPWEN